MDLQKITSKYDFTGRSVVMTGGTSVLGSAIVRALAGCGANVTILARNIEKAETLIQKSSGASRVIAIYCDVLELDTLKAAARVVQDEFGQVDCLINGVGGNDPRATTSSDLAFFDLPEEALRYVFDLNLIAIMLPSQIFGKQMVEQNKGVILNISSMNAFRPLTRIPAYSAAKAGVSNFTQWLAVHMAQEYSPNIRVNGVAPGFFLTQQNRFLLTNEKTGELTPRGKTIIDHTPMGRFGDPEDLLGAILWLLSPASAFVTGVVVPVDGGFSAFSGV